MATAVNTVHGSSNQLNGSTARVTDLPSDGAQTDIVLVHDYLNQWGGAERVVLEMASLWPQAPLYTSLYRPESTFPEFGPSTFAHRCSIAFPWTGASDDSFPLYPAAFRSLGTLSADIVGLKLRAAGPQSSNVSGHITPYCHTPARWLYGGEHLDHRYRTEADRVPDHALLSEVGPQRRRGRLTSISPTANRCARRIKRVYGIDAVVVHPPVDVDRFVPSETRRAPARRLSPASVQARRRRR